jgi:hypothetical protein
MSTAAEIIDQIRKRYLMDTQDPPLWCDEVMLDNYNEARREAALRALIFNDVATALPDLTLTADNPVYTLDNRILKVRTIGLSWPEGMITNLKPMTVTQMGQEFGRFWQSDTGQPIAYWPNQHSIRLYPIPNAEWAGQTLTVDGFRFPLAELALTDEETEFGTLEVNALMYWVCHLAYLLEDSDIQSKVNRSALYADKFAEKFGPPVKLSQRLHDLRSTTGFQASGMRMPEFGMNSSRLSRVI